MDKFATEMKTTYNFGEFESAASPQRLRDAAQSVTSGAFSPREDAAASAVLHNDHIDNRDGVDDKDDAAAMARAAHDAMGSAAANRAAKSRAYDGKSGAAAAASGDHTSSNTRIVKEVLGLNKSGKTVKGANGAEQLSLEARWKNALAEEARLQELEQRTAAGEAQTRVLGERANFPPAVLCLRPLVYHNIDEVTTAHQRRRFVRSAFVDWLVVCALLVINAGVTIGVTFAPYGRNVVVRETSAQRAQSTILALVYLVGVPLSFLLWYWRVYKACSTGQPTNYLLALCGLLLALAQSIFVVVAPAYYGVCSIAFAQRTQQIKATGAVAPVVVVLVLWAAQCAVTVYMLVMTFIYYRRDLAARRMTRTFASVVAS